MEKTIDIVSELNLLLDSDRPSKRVFNRLTGVLINSHKVKPQLLDFMFFNENRLEELKKKKIELISIQDFETASICRELEKECLVYIDNRKEYKIERSSFSADDEFLFYLCTGKSVNDEIVRSWFKKLLDED